MWRAPGCRPFASRDMSAAGRAAEGAAPAVHKAREIQGRLRRRESPSISQVWVTVM